MSMCATCGESINDGVCKCPRGLESMAGSIKIGWWIASYPWHWTGSKTRSPRRFLSAWTSSSTARTARPFASCSISVERKSRSTTGQ